MATKNDITGDSIQTRGVSDKYRDNYDLIFRKKKKESVEIDNEEKNESCGNNTDNRQQITE